MKSIIKMAAASLALAGLAAVTTPALAGPAHVEVRVGGGYYPAPVYVQPRVVYDAPVSIYRGRDERAWREHAWRERQRREYWRERNAWREHEWREHHDRGRWGRGVDGEHGYRGDWR